MEEKDLVLRIEQFFNAELSVEEECELCRYLSENEVPSGLRKDKEAILMLCGYGMDVELPAGAQERIEAMIDALVSEEVQPVADEVVVERAGARSRYRVSCGKVRPLLQFLSPGICSWIMMSCHRVHSHSWMPGFMPNCPRRIPLTILPMQWSASRVLSVT